MKKETMIVTMIETTGILPNCFEATIGIEELKRQMKQRLKAKLEGLGFDDVNITNVKVFEIKKDERISTEDLITAAKHCESDFTNCSDCIIRKFVGELEVCKVTKWLADRLEELHNQQTATPAKKADTKCETCKYQHFDPFENPCFNCGNYEYWAEKWGG